MTPLDTALAYAIRAWAVFPCRWRGFCRKHPLTPNGFHDASTDLNIIIGWWRHWPDALIGVATGRASGFVVLDIDVKYADHYGFDTLDALGLAILPEAPMAHTGSGGLHLYFALPRNIEIDCTRGDKGRGIGRGLDWRGRGGYVIAPSPGSGYEWDAHWNLKTVPFASVPPALLPQAPERMAPGRPVEPTVGVSPYARAALNRACRQIVVAPNGQQEAALNGEAFAIGTLAGAGAVPPDFALSVLLYAAKQIQDYDARRPWQFAEIARKINRAFDAGMRHPRQTRCA